MWERGGVIEVQFLSSGERMMSSAHWRDCSKQGTWTAHSLEGIQKVWAELKEYWLIKHQGVEGILFWLL